MVREFNNAFDSSFGGPAYTCTLSGIAPITIDFVNSPNAAMQLGGGNTSYVVITDTTKFYNPTHPPTNRFHLTNGARLSTYYNSTNGRLFLWGSAQPIKPIDGYYWVDFVNSTSGGSLLGGTTKVLHETSGGVILSGTSNYSVETRHFINEKIEGEFTPSYDGSFDVIPGLCLGGETQPLTADFINSASGGVRVGGTAQRAANFITSVSGGLHVAGTAQGGRPRKANFINLTSGGSALGGYIQPPIILFINTPNGGLGLGGSTQPLTARFINPTYGGLGLGGSAPHAVNLVEIIVDTFTSDFSSSFEIPRGLRLGGTARCAVNLITATSGGLYIGGTARGGIPRTVTLINTTRGGLHCGGTAQRTACFVNFTNGGLHCGGTAQSAEIIIVSTFGGLNLSGTASHGHTYITNPMSFSSAYDNEFNSTWAEQKTDYENTTSGGLILGGTSQSEIDLSIPATGYLHLGGITPYTVRFIHSMHGGLYWSGYTQITSILNHFNSGVARCLTSDNIIKNAEALLSNRNILIISGIETPVLASGYRFDHNPTWCDVVIQKVQNCDAMLPSVVVRRQGTYMPAKNRNDQIRDRTIARFT